MKPDERLKPNYMVIGAAKCATTTVCSLLGGHPDVFMVACKEPQFFNHDQVFARGFEWYESLYREAGNRPLRGEGSNAYTMRERYPKTVERLRAYAPQLKLIYLVRHPFEKIESFWLELRSQSPDYVHHDFNKAVRLNRDWLTDSCNYAAQLEPYRRHYGDESIHVVFYEDFCEDPASVLSSCWRFLGADAGRRPPVPAARLNTSEGKAVASPWLSRLHTIPGYQRAMRRIPFPLRERVARRIWFRRMKGRPAWRPETKQWVSDLLRDDLSDFLVRQGKPADFWSFDGSAGHEA
jgi:hypothetical protein